MNGINFKLEVQLTFDWLICLDYYLIAYDRVVLFLQRTSYRRSQRTKLKNGGKWIKTLTILCQWHNTKVNKKASTRNLTFVKGKMLVQLLTYSLILVCLQPTIELMIKCQKMNDEVEALRQANQDYQESNKAVSSWLLSNDFSFLWRQDALFCFTSNLKFVLSIYLSITLFVIRRLETTKIYKLSTTPFKRHSLKSSKKPKPRYCHFSNRFLNSTLHLHLQ